MTIPTTYTELQAEVANWLNRTDLTSDIPTFIAFGEARINRIATLSNQETTAAVNTTNGQNYTNLPDGFLEHISLTYDDNLYENPAKVNLQDLDQGKIETSNGVPRYFAISDNKYYWDQAPDSVYNLTARYWKKWDIATDSTNWILTNYPDTYLYASLAQAAAFIGHPMKQEWEVAAKSSLDELEYQSSKLKKSNLRTELGNRYGRKYNINGDF